MPDTLALQGKVAIVTGSGRENGIGAGIALALARNGASVVVNYVSDSSKHRAENVCTTLHEAGGKAIAIQASVDTTEGAKYLVDKTLEGFGTDHIDILGKLYAQISSSELTMVVNNAATACLCPITDEPNMEELTKVFQVNVLGAFYMVHYVVAHMPPGGRIINISSTNAKRGNVIASSYAASKAALDNLTWTWAGEVSTRMHSSFWYRLIRMNSLVAVKALLLTQLLLVL
jgi:NAD(P)-dependent dehydrogenase (short-subunit alcohol dehydrogenase family)